MKLNTKTIMQQLQQLDTEQTKHTYLRYGAKEPLFGILTGALTVYPCSLCNE